MKAVICLSLLAIVNAAGEEEGKRCPECKGRVSNVYEVVTWQPGMSLVPLDHGKPCPEGFHDVGSFCKQRGVQVSSIFYVLCRSRANYHDSRKEEWRCPLKLYCAPHGIDDVGRIDSVHQEAIDAQNDFKPKIDCVPKDEARAAKLQRGVARQALMEGRLAEREKRKEQLAIEDDDHVRHDKTLRTSMAGCSTSSAAAEAVRVSDLPPQEAVVSTEEQHALVVPVTADGRYDDPMAGVEIEIRTDEVCADILNRLTESSPESSAHRPRARQRRA